MCEPSEVEMARLRMNAAKLEDPTERGRLSTKQFVEAFNAHLLLNGSGLLTYDGPLITFKDLRWRSYCGVPEPDPPKE